MAPIVLVHGAWLGSWCWDKVNPHLSAAGYRPLAVDLPGRKNNVLAVEDVSLDAFVNYVLQVLDGLSEPATLVGHSLGGVTLSKVAELAPEHVRALVYVTAFLLRDGESAREILLEDHSIVRSSRKISDDGLTSRLLDDKLRDALCADCSTDDVERARSLIVPEALAIARTPVHTTAKRFGHVPRFYIECLRDRIIPLQAQRRMVASTPCIQVFSMDTSHSPFFAAPKALAQHILTSVRWVAPPCD